MRPLTAGLILISVVHAQDPRPPSNRPPSLLRQGETIATPASAPTPAPAQPPATTPSPAPAAQQGSVAKPRAAFVPGAPQTFAYSDNAAGCDHRYLSGQLWEQIESGDIGVAVTARDNGEKLIVTLFVSNHSQSPVDVLPQQVSASLVEPKTLALKLADPVNIAKSIQRRARWASALGQWGANMQRDQVQTQANTSGQVNVNTDYYGRNGAQVGRGEGRGTYNEQTTVTTTMPNWAAQQQARENAMRRMAGANDVVQTIAVRSLKAQTLVEGQAVLGDVYFDRDRAMGKRHTIVVRAAIGDSVFEFVFGRS